MRNVWHFIRIEKSTICTSCWADCLGSSHLGVNVCHKSVHIVVVFVAFPSAQSFDAARIIPSLRPHMFAMFKQKPWNKTTKISVYYSVTHPTTKTKRVKKKHSNDIHPHPPGWVKPVVKKATRFCLTHTHSLFPLFSHHIRSKPCSIQLSFSSKMIYEDSIYGGVWLLLQISNFLSVVVRHLFGSTSFNCRCVIQL